VKYFSLKKMQIRDVKNKGNRTNIETERRESTVPGRVVLQCGNECAASVSRAPHSRIRIPDTCEVSRAYAYTSRAERVPLNKHNFDYENKTDPYK
jgi:hypothetical protein